jgi:CRP/FNR family transcriptional regulator, dissimilatory nitrate respiration regulator
MAATMLDPKTIEGIPLFEPLDAEQRRRVLESARVLRLERGQILFTRGDPAQGFYLVLEGTIKLYLLSPEGEEKVVEVMQPGQTFAEAVMFMEQEAYPVNAAALTNLRLAAFSNAVFIQLLRESPGLALRMLATLSRRLHGLLHQIDELALQDATHRLVAYLLMLPREVEDTIALDLPKQVIAARLAITPETLSRTLAVLRERRLLAVEGDRILLLDPEGLHRLLAEP